MIDMTLGDEPGRLAALHRYQMLDTPPEPAFERIVALVRSILDVPMASVTLVDEQRQWFKARNGIALGSTAREISFCTHTIRARAPLLVADARIDPRFKDNPLVVGPPYIAAYLGCPLTSPDGYNVGALCAIDRRSRHFTEAQVRILSDFAAIVIDNFELRQIARRDHLTGFLTRRALLEEMVGEIALRDAGGPSACLVSFDIDRFKSINDRHGHAVGDQVLQTVAARCTRIAGDHGWVGRIGGEEFAWLIPSTRTDNAARAAEQLRSAIATLPPPAGVPPVTASFGVAQLTPGISTVEAWLNAADGALYAAKRAGRNLVCVT